MLPIIGVPQSIAQGMERFRKVFCRAEGFEHVCRFITGLVLNPNKTLQGIYDLQVWEGEAPNRRAMHEAVFESGWDSGALIQHHRTEVAQAYRGRGRQMILLDWTLSHHARGPTIYAITKGYDEAHYAFDNGVLTLELTRLIERGGKHWVSELEVSRHIQWQGHWRGVDEVASDLCHSHPESFREARVSCRNGEEKVFWAFTKVVRLKRYGCKRLVIVHERVDLSDPPDF